jgi:tRNA threonylcarbamoyladenosine biosynthesis protein TsaB
MVHILHIDTSGDTGLVALAADGTVLHTRKNTDTRNHAATINIMIDELMHDAGMVLKDIDAVAVCAGPGSYTGLRIGMATAKALCYVLDKPLIAANKLDLLAFEQYHEHLSAYDFYVAVLMARDKEYFICSHNDKFDTVVAPAHVMEEQLPVLETWKGRLRVAGNVNENILRALIGNDIEMVNAGIVDEKSWAIYAFQQYNCNETVNLSTAEPFYLKQVFTHKSNKIN